MKKFRSIVPRWLPALIMMGVIFAISSQPRDNLPDFLSWDYFVKKSSHMIGYALLALSYAFLLRDRIRPRREAWLLAILFAATDEFHQSFVAGRHASLFDVMIFDNFGALAALFLSSVNWKRGAHNVDRA